MTKKQLIDDIHLSCSQIIEKVRSVPEELFYQKENGKWSIAENLAHLTLSAKLMNRALNAPKFGLIWRFGIHRIPFRNIQWMKETYSNASIPKTTGFEPRMRQDSTKAYELKEYQEKHTDLIKSVEKWSDLPLDKLQLPHIAFGKLSIREYLMFIPFHNRHHEKAIDKILTRP